MGRSHCPDSQSKLQLITVPHPQLGSGLYQTHPSVPCCSPHRVPASDGGGSTSSTSVDDQFHGVGEGANRSGEREPPSCPSASTCPSSPETLVMRPGAKKKAALGSRNLASLLTGLRCLSQPPPDLCSFPLSGCLQRQQVPKELGGTHQAQLQPFMPSSGRGVWLYN